MRARDSRLLGCPWVYVARLTRTSLAVNSKAEIAQAHADYQKTQFGGWPWDADAVVFDRSQGRFADMVAPDGTVTRTLPPLPAKAEL